MSVCSSDICTENFEVKKGKSSSSEKIYDIYLKLQNPSGGTIPMHKYYESIIDHANEVTKKNNYNLDVLYDPYFCTSICSYISDRLYGGICEKNEDGSMEFKCSKWNILWTPKVSLIGTNEFENSLVDNIRNKTNTIGNVKFKIDNNFFDFKTFIFNLLDVNENEKTKRNWIIFPLSVPGHSISAYIYRGDDKNYEMYFCDPNGKTGRDKNDQFSSYINYYRLYFKYVCDEYNKSSNGSNAGNINIEYKDYLLHDLAPQGGSVLLYIDTEGFCGGITWMIIFLIIINVGITPAKLYEYINHRYNQWNKYVSKDEDRTINRQITSSTGGFIRHPLDNINSDTEDEYMGGYLKKSNKKRKNKDKFNEYMGGYLIKSKKQTGGAYDINSFFEDVISDFNTNGNDIYIMYNTYEMIQRISFDGESQENEFTELSDNYTGNKVLLKVEHHVAFMKFLNDKIKNKQIKITRPRVPEKKRKIITYEYRSIDKVYNQKYSYKNIESYNGDGILEGYSEYSDIYIAMLKTFLNTDGLKKIGDTEFFTGEFSSEVININDKNYFVFKEFETEPMNFEEGNIYREVDRLNSVNFVESNPDLLSNENRNNFLNNFKLTDLFNEGNFKVTYIRPKAMDIILKNISSNLKQKKDYGTLNNLRKSMLHYADANVIKINWFESHIVMFLLFINEFLNEKMPNVISSEFIIKE